MQNRLVAGAAAAYSPEWKRDMQRLQVPLYYQKCRAARKLGVG